jgi:hypothetical protein
MTYDAAGNLYVCEHATSKLIMETAAGERRILASHWQGKELNSPNDVVLRSDKMIYFSDPIYGRVPVFGVERSQELNFQGLFRVSPDGKLHLESDDFEAPNGLCFSPDEKLLYVANSDPKDAVVRRFRVTDKNTPEGGEVFVTIRPGVPDGIHLHSLIYRRVVRWAAGASKAKALTRRNSMTSPYLWLLCMCAVVPAMLFWDNTGLSALFILLFGLGYTLLYWRIVRFRSPRWLFVRTHPPAHEPTEQPGQG